MDAGVTATLASWTRRPRRPRAVLIGASESDCTAKDWDAAVLLVSATPARTRAGLSAKAQLLLELSPTAAGVVGQVCISPEEALLTSLLHDVLAIMVRHSV